MVKNINVSKFLDIDKPIKVKGTVKNTRKVYEMQLTLAKANKSSTTMQNEVDKINNKKNKTEKDDMKLMDANIDIIDTMSSILTDCETFTMSILNLPDKYINKLEDLDQDQLMELVTSIVSQFMGVEAESVEDSKKE